MTAWPEVMVAVATGLAYLGWKVSQRSRSSAADRELALVRIANASTSVGQRVRVRGVVRARTEAMPAPITKKPCLYARIVVYSASRRQLKQLAAENHGIDALLDDATGTILVPLSGAVVTVEQAIEPWEATQAEEGRIEERLRKIRKMWLRPFRFREDLVQSGDELEVTGRLAIEHGADGEGGSYRDAPRRLALSSKHPVFVRVVARPEHN
jgi:hypothetical protein